MESHQVILTQIEYYMSDKNLAKDKFFREQIMTGKDGYIPLTHFLNCNNVKKSGWTVKDILDACVKSTELEFEAETVRRAGNKALPEKQAATNTDVKKRDAKAQEKAEQDNKQEDEFDEDGKIVLVEKDFDNPIIVSYNTTVAEGEEFKVDWKQVEKAIKEKFAGLKLIYSRMDPHGGHVAFSQLRLKRDLLDELCKEPLPCQERPFTFAITEGEDLKEFWQKQGGHYQFCIQNRLRTAKKAQKAKQIEKRESVKRAKTSYEIAGVYYLDINKVKSKSRAILNLKKDGERIDGNDAEFLKELL